MKIAGKESKEISRVQGRVMKGVMVLLLATGLAGHAQAAPGNGSAVAATVTAPTAATSTPLPAPEITSVAAIPESTPESVLTSASALTSESIPAPMVQPVTAPVPQKLAMDLSVWGMYQNADVVVKGVMIGLVLASIVTWTILFSKGTELFRARRRLRQEHEVIGAVTDLDTASERAEDFGQGSVSSLLLHEALNERLLSIESNDNNGIKERTAFRLERRVAAIGRQMGKGNGFLATIGAISPFVGLFGTVWGIMNSFIGIAHSQTTNLAVVAPGIAEALLATALGLVAAIPAVVIYNIFARQIGNYRAQVGDVAAQVLLLLSRDLDLASSAEVKSPRHPHQLRAG
ncbi:MULTISPECIES: tol-pal system-associated acyl-CoA thioesterase [Yersinia pseudotuberculosis complex]|uniref:Biopolymer transport protein ExbB n=1 Tax=Yersinia pseudotuberculosis serotype I (strain IP32953) TaxID=273123 RepID=Q665X7_YERPS|nr:MULTISPECIES: tol-pal system-associated acyl-CoA thioesterase [Yersinia pseudotuberculosis complex]CQD55374.1 TonB complex protein [Yersinia intermedia]ABP38879.1 MotA/TolQ/ExbB proton channel family protein [Yersinia pestis Pestoides F]AJI97327.1 tonB-system energizer ExbB [Yersinia pestis Pestoides F]AJJ01338.1 tonB-system energizer ExbB [Yersinia pseudotuberculosis]AJJ56099.1 tonB-system energizer ExbB [Yersinia pseudotuberculosis IP 32953]